MAENQNKNENENMNDNINEKVNENETFILLMIFAVIIIIYSIFDLFRSPANPLVKFMPFYILLLYKMGMIRLKKNKKNKGD